MADVAENLQPETFGNPELDRLANSHPLLAALDAKSLETLMGLSKLTVYRPKRTVVRSGEEAKFAHLLIDGIVRVFHRNDRGEELTIQLLTGPTVFNDARVLTESVAEENVVTLERSTVLSVPAEVFRRLVTLRPQFNEVLVKDQAERACLASDLNRRLAFNDIDTRLANLLLDYAALVGTQTPEGHIRLQLPFSQQSMANDLGASRKSLNRALERLRELGAVMKSQARYEIRNVQLVQERASCATGIRHSSDGSTVSRLQSTSAANTLE